MPPATTSAAPLFWWVVLAILIILVIPSLRVIGPTEVGLVTKRLGFKRLSQDNPIAFEGEAGYQADLLMPGWRWKFWILYKVEKFPWVEVPAGEIGVVVAQVGRPLPIGAKSAVYNERFGNFTNLQIFVGNGGEKGVQRPVLPPGSLLPVHPVAFLVITKRQVYGLPIIPELRPPQQVGSALEGEYSSSDNLMSRNDVESLLRKQGLLVQQNSSTQREILR